jgi:hypothetical protein
MRHPEPRARAGADDGPGALAQAQKLARPLMAQAARPAVPEDVRPGSERYWPDILVVGAVDGDDADDEPAAAQAHEPDHHGPFRVRDRDDVSGYKITRKHLVRHM